MAQKQVMMIPINLEKVSSGSNTDEVNICEEGVDSADCRKVLFNCLKNLEQKRNDLYMLANNNKEMQIKGHKQLIDLTCSKEFLTTKFYELKKERKEKDELINSLQIEVFSLLLFFYIWVFFHNHSRITGLQGKRGGYFCNSSLPLPPASQTFRH